MIRLLIILGIASVAFASGFTVSSKWYQVEILKAKVLFLEDQALKKKKQEEEVSRIEGEGRVADVDLQKKVDVLNKGVPKNVRTSDRVILPSTWMQQLGRIR